jgi:hypothetical protein
MQSRLRLVFKRLNTGQSITSSLASLRDGAVFESGFGGGGGVKMDG